MRVSELQTLTNVPLENDLEALWPASFVSFVTC